MEEYDVNKDNIDNKSESVHYEKRVLGEDAIAIVRYTHQKEPEVLRKKDLKCTSIFESENDSYLRAYSFGQGCWDELYEISEEETRDLLNEWGYKED